MNCLSAALHGGDMSLGKCLDSWHDKPQWARRPAAKCDLNVLPENTFLPYDDHSLPRLREKSPSRCSSSICDLLARFPWPHVLSDLSRLLGSQERIPIGKPISKFTHVDGYGVRALFAHIQERSAQEVTWHITQLSKVIAAQYCRPLHLVQRPRKWILIKNSHGYLYWQFGDNELLRRAQQHFAGGVVKGDYNLLLCC